MKEINAKSVRTEGERKFFVDTARPELGEYYIDDEGRNIFRNALGEYYYFGQINGILCPITIYPSHVKPRPRNPVGMPDISQSMRNGAFRRGNGIGSN